MSISQSTTNKILHIEYADDGTVTSAWVQQRTSFSDGSSEVSASLSNVPLALTADQKTQLASIMQTAISPTPAANTDQMWERIKGERTRRQNGGLLVTVQAATSTTAAVQKWFQTDADSRIQYLGLMHMVGAGTLPANLQWKTMDNSFVTMTAALATDIFNGMAANDQTIFQVAETHRENMLASATPLTYDYSANWPAIYQG